LSADWRFGIAYNAALKLCTILMYSEGFRPEKALAHYRTVQALPLILGPERADDAAYLDRCRTKRNTVEYDYVGGATEADADELIEFTEELEKDVRDWLKKKHPEFLRFYQAAPSMKFVAKAFNHQAKCRNGRLTLWWRLRVRIGRHSAGCNRAAHCAPLPHWPKYSAVEFNSDKPRA